MFSFAIKTMGWRNFCLQLVVRCPFALCCISSWLGGEGGCCVDGSLSQGQEIILKIKHAGFSFMKSPFLGCVAVVCCVGFFLNRFSSSVAHIWSWQDFLSLGIFLYVCVYYTLFFPTCISIIFNFCNGRDVCIAIRIPLSELLVFPDHSSAFIKAVMIWEHESLFQIQQLFYNFFSFSCNVKVHIQTWVLV